MSPRSTLFPASPLSWRVRLSRLAVAWVLVGSGIALMIRSDLGVAPIDSLITGLSENIGVGFGVTFVAFSLLLYLIGALLGSPPGPASVAGSVVIGPFIGVVLDVLGTPASLAPRWAAYGAALLMIAGGIAFAISTNLGPGPTEVVMLGLHRRGLPIVTARWLVDGLLMVGALLVRGPLGIGTAVFLICMAPLVKAGLSLLRYDPLATAGA